ncbi:MAG: malic enzyme-like NAD(P)-binding protein [Myxococcales bacterium]
MASIFESKDRTSTQQAALDYHSSGRPGKIEIVPTKPVATARDLSLAYSPGVAEPCLAIASDKDLSYKYTARGNLVAVISNGTAVLGLGDIGAWAAKPVMEGKGVLFKKFADIDVFDLEVNLTDIDTFCTVVKSLEPSFGGINLEDVKSPECFIIERRLRSIMGIPVFHDDQHGTAIVVLAALLNAMRVVGKELGEIRVIVAGVGAAGVAVTKILLEAGVRDVVGCDSAGAIYRERPGLTGVKAEYAAITNPGGVRGSADDALEGADVFIGLSQPGAVSADAIGRMADRAVVFAMANPTPEVLPEEIEGVAEVIATGRSDYPNQINNVLAFPGVFRGALDVRAPRIDEEMKVAAAHAIAATIPPGEIAADYIVPSVFNRAVASAVAAAVAESAEARGVARHRRPAASP